MNIFKCTAAGLLLVILTVSCLCASGGNSSNISLKDFFGLKPTVQIEWPNMVLTIPTNYPSSSAYIAPRVKIEGDTIVIKAKAVLSKKPATTTFNLSKLGMAKEKTTSAKAFWINPDGTKQPLEVVIKKAGNK